MDVIDHYDLLIEEQNDPFRDPPVLQEYMNKWDGEPFLEALELSKANFGRPHATLSEHGMSVKSTVFEP